MSERPCRPWQRPPQFQHGHHDNAFGDAEATGALLARLAAARDRDCRPASPVWPRPRSGTPAGVPFEATEGHDAAVAYLGLLDRILEDRVITAAEMGRLKEFATEWGIGALEAACLHRGYVARVWEQACADATITPAELRDIVLLAGLLGVPVARSGSATPGVAGPSRQTRRRPPPNEDLPLPPRRMVMAAAEPADRVTCTNGADTSIGPVQRHLAQGPEVVDGHDAAMVYAQQVQRLGWTRTRLTRRRASSGAVALLITRIGIAIGTPLAARPGHGRHRRHQRCHDLAQQPEALGSLRVRPARGGLRPLGTARSGDAGGGWSSSPDR